MQSKVFATYFIQLFLMYFCSLWKHFLLTSVSKLITVIFRNCERRWIYFQVNSVAAKCPEQIFGEKQPSLQRKIYVDLLVFASEAVPCLLSPVYFYTAPRIVLSSGWHSINRTDSLISGSGRHSEVNGVEGGRRKWISLVLEIHFLGLISLFIPEG